MSDRDDFGAFLIGFVVGGVAGAVAALLLAPQSGEETRALIKEKSIELRDKAAEQALMLAALKLRDQDDAATQKFLSEAKKLAPEMVGPAFDLEAFAQRQGIIIQKAPVVPPPVAPSPSPSAFAPTACVATSAICSRARTELSARSDANDAMRLKIDSRKTSSDRRRFVVVVVTCCGLISVQSDDRTTVPVSLAARAISHNHAVTMTTQAMVRRITTLATCTLPSQCGGMPCCRMSGLSV